MKSFSSSWRRAVTESSRPRRIPGLVVENPELLALLDLPLAPWTREAHSLARVFYDKFEIDLGDPERFGSLGELVAEIYRTIHRYNTTRIHTALKMSPSEFAKNAGSTCGHMEEGTWKVCPR
jgi:hypothetical protein